MKKLNIKTRTLYRAAVFLFIAVVLSTYALSGPLARYVSSDSADDSARVAKFSVTMAGTLTEHFNIDGITPGYEDEKSFTVTNNSEVTVKYTATIETTGNIPLRFDRTQVEGILVPGESSGEKKIKVSWDNNDKEYIFNNVFDVVTVTIVCQQVD